MGAIILSRLDSKRLPGKALHTVAGQPLISYVVNMCQSIKGVDNIILATSDRVIDDPLAKYAKDKGMLCARGSVNDVAGRFLSTMEKFELDAAIRINGDSPLNNVELLSKCVAIFRENNFDLVSNIIKRTYPYGMSVEVISKNAMKSAYFLMNNDLQREHVTKYFYDHKNDFRIYDVISEVEHYSGVQLSVDTKEDLKKFSWIVSKLGKDITKVDIDILVNLAVSFKSSSDN
jgi:spore coat polysaccharide biosynthesis protein SpsF